MPSVPAVQCRSAVIGESLIVEIGLIFEIELGTYPCYPVVPVESAVASQGDLALVT